MLESAAVFNSLTRGSYNINYAWLFSVSAVPKFCFTSFIHLKLELLTQFPTSNGEQYISLWKIHISKVKLYY